MNKKIKNLRLICWLIMVFASINFILGQTFEDDKLIELSYWLALGTIWIMIDQFLNIKYKE